MRTKQDLVEWFADESGELTGGGKALAWSALALFLVAVIASLAGYGVVVAVIALVVMLGIGLGVLAYTATARS